MISSVGDNGSARYIKLYKLHLEPDHKENEKRLTFFFCYTIYDVQTFKDKRNLFLLDLYISAF